MFFIQNVNGGHIPAFEYLPCGAITPKVGMALIQSSGNFAIATGTNKPTHISMIEKSAACSAGDPIPVIEVKDNVFETTLSADGSSLNIGDSVTMHATSGMQVTATTVSGVAKIVGFPDGVKTSGARVHVVF